MRLLTTTEAARLLDLHPQTVYRKCQRGELPSVRFGRTIRIDADRLGLRPVETTEDPSLPSFLSHLFWDCTMADLKPSDPIVLERILESGDLPEWRWLESRVDETVIRRFLETSGKRRLTPRSLRFWTRFYGGPDEDEPSAAEPENSLGETGWR